MKHNLPPKFSFIFWGVGRGRVPLIYLSGGGCSGSKPLQNFLALFYIKKNKKNSIQFRINMISREEIWLLNVFHAGLSAGTTSLVGTCFYTGPLAGTAY